MSAGHCSSADGLVLDTTLPGRSRSRSGTSGLFGVLVATLALWPAPAASQASLPNLSSTPGALNPAVTQATISSTICRSGFAAAMRPPAWVTSAAKERQLRAAGVPNGSGSAYEEDHLIPLELGGAPTDERNLWPQPRRPADGWDASRKDDLEGILHRDVCAGRLRLADAQRALTSDWHAAWRRFAPARSERIARPGSPGPPEWRWIPRVEGRDCTAWADRRRRRFRSHGRRMRRWNEQLLP